MSDHPPSPRRARRELIFHSTVPRARVRKNFLLSCARHAARRLPSGYGMLTLVLINDRKMAALHRKYSGIPGTTDVLTFDLTEEDATSIDGDIYICVDQARRQSSELRIPLHREVARLAVHGILHLAGYSDKTDAGQTEMRRLEDRSLTAGEGRS